MSWIKLHRSILEWEWYDEPNTFRLFIHCLLKANHSEKTWRGTKINRGEFITSLQKLSNETGLTVKKIRTILGKLKGKELAIKTSSQNTVIQVIKYDNYQITANEGQTDGQTKGKQRATTKNNKNNKKENKEVCLDEIQDSKKHVIEKWIQYRKEIRKPLKQSTIDSIIKKMNENSVASCEAVVEKSISNGWTGLFWDNITNLVEEKQSSFTFDKNKL